jgi:hypothetical protein
MATLFEQKAPSIMRRLMADFALDTDSAAAIVGNLGHESAGFKFLQEIKPLVPGSKGGYGWAQWTGPRRRAYEGYCKSHNLDPASDAANYGYLAYELHATETSAIPAVKRAKTLHDKVIAFELAFERAAPQYKGYPSRERYATLALAAYRPDAAMVDAPKLTPTPVTPIALPAPVGDSKPMQSGKHDAVALGLLGTIAAAAAATYQWAMEHLPEIFIGVVALIVIALLVYRFLWKGHWPWTSKISTGDRLQALLHSLPQPSAVSLEQRSADLSAAASALQVAKSSRATSASTQRRKPSARRSSKIRKQPKSSLARTPKKAKSSPRGRKSKSSG